MLNKSIIIAIIAIAIIVGISLVVFSNFEGIDQNSVTSEITQEPVGKKFTATLSENVGVKIP